MPVPTTGPNLLGETTPTFERAAVVWNAEGAGPKNNRYKLSQKEYEYH